MTEKLNKTLRDNPIARWIALLLLSLTMFFAYMFVDVLSPLTTLLNAELGWNPEVFGTYAGSEFFLNVFVLFLLFAGVILDKMGIRFSAILSGSLMVIGAAIKYYAVSEYFRNGGVGFEALSSFLPSFPATAKLACVGFAIFGCGCEMAGIVVSKAIVKWFKGKELALAMGLEMAIARLGVFAVFRLSPYIAEMGGTPDVVRPIAFCSTLLCIGLLSFVVYSFLDKKLDNEVGEMGTEPEEPFRIKDLKLLFTNKPFLIIALLCVLYYSAIFPFQKFACSMLESRLGFSSKEAADLFSFFPIGAMILTPFIGFFLDKKGKAASLIILGAILMTACHLIFAIYPLDNSTLSLVITYTAITLLGISFSLVPASMWPSVPKLVDNKVLGSAYSVIFWIQNVGLMIFPFVIGYALNSSNPGVAERIAEGAIGEKFNYTLPMLIFASLGVIAFILGCILKSEDKKNGYGLEKPNIQQD